MTGVLDGWEEQEFTHGGTTRRVYRSGQGPGVIVIHEIPGITPTVAAFAGDVVAAGFTVVMPSLVGTPGRSPSTVYELTSLVRVCVSGEFTTWSTGRTSPVVSWLRALAAALHTELGGPGVGAVGMCFSGGFALAMVVDTHTVAPVLSQPSLPFAVGRRRSASLGLSTDDERAVAARVAAGCPVLALHFSGDRLVGTRPAVLRRTSGPGVEVVEYPSRRRRDHSVLTEQRQEDAVSRVLELFRERLSPR